MNKEIKNNEHLNEDVEIEEVYPDLEQETQNTQDVYIVSMRKYAKKILKELESFLQKPMEKWRQEKEKYEIIDILSLVDKCIKTQLSANDKKL